MTWGAQTLSCYFALSSSGCVSKLIIRCSVFISVKAGGMRIVQKHPHSGDAKEEKDKDDQEWESPRWESSGGSQMQLNINVCSPLCAWRTPRLCGALCCVLFFSWSVRWGFCSQEGKDTASRTCPPP